MEPDINPPCESECRHSSHLLPHHSSNRRVKIKTTFPLHRSGKIPIFHASCMLAASSPQPGAGRERMSNSCRERPVNKQSEFLRLSGRTRRSLRNFPAGTSQPKRQKASVFPPPASTGAGIPFRTLFGFSCQPIFSRRQKKKPPFLPVTFSTLDDIQEQK